MCKNNQNTKIRNRAEELFQKHIGSCYCVMEGWGYRAAVRNAIEEALKENNSMPVSKPVVKTKTVTKVVYLERDIVKELNHN